MIYTLKCARARYRRVLAKGGRCLATWILATTSLHKGRPSLKWFMLSESKDVGILYEDDQTRMAYEKMIYSKSFMIKPGDFKQPYAHILISDEKQLFNIRVEHPYDLHSYARALNAYHEKGIIPFDENEKGPASCPAGPSCRVYAAES